MSARWLVLGFTADAIIVAWQDSRLSGECLRVWRGAGRPTDFGVCEAVGEGEHMIYWFVNGVAARLLDEQKVDWRRFVIGERDAPPESARNPLIDSESGR